MRRSFTPTLSELQAFHACAETGSVTLAAEALGLTQSAVSRSLATLEGRLGVLLFSRIRKRLALSDAGRAMLRDTDRVMSDLNAAALTVMSFGGNSNVLRLAVLPTFGARWLIPRLAGLRRTVPELSLDIASRLHTVDFAQDPFDAAIQRAEQAGPGTASVPLMEERLIAVAAPSLLAHNASFPDEPDIARLPLLQQATRPELWLDWFRDAGLDPVSILRGARFEHFGMVIAAAVAGLGVALVPDVLVEDDLREERLQKISSRVLPGRSPYALIYPLAGEASPSIRALRGWLQGDAVSQA